MMNCLAVGLGGFAGAVLRYLIGLIPTGETMIFSGKNLLYQYNWMYCDRSNHSTGGEIVCSTKDDFVSEGGSLRWISTFSTFALESSDLIRDGHMGIALCYVLLSVLVGVLAIFAVEYLTVR